MGHLETHFNSNWQNVSLFLFYTIIKNALLCSKRSKLAVTGCVAHASFEKTPTDVRVAVRTNVCSINLYILFLLHRMYKTKGGPSVYKTNSKL